MFQRRHLPGPPGATLRQLVSNWGAPDDIFLSSDSIYRDYAFWQGERHFAPGDLPAVEGRVFGYRTGELSAVIVYLTKEGTVTAVLEGGT